MKGLTRPGETSPQASGVEVEKEKDEDDKETETDEQPSHRQQHRLPHPWCPFPSSYNHLQCPPPAHVAPASLSSKCHRPHDSKQKLGVTLDMNNLVSFF